MHLVSFKEVEMELMGMPANKSIRPDGFTFNLFKARHSFLGHEIHGVVEDIRKYQYLWGGHNATFISVIPTVGKLEDLGGF